MKYFYLFIFLIISPAFHSQELTVGVLTNTEDAFDGYTLLTPVNSKNSYLINNCGEVVQQWTSEYTPGAATYLLENGNLLKTGSIANPVVQFGGVGGVIESFDWEGNLLWQYKFTSDTMTQHHDIYPLPNGNILVLIADVMTEAEAILAGRDPNLIEEDMVFNEKIIELKPLDEDNYDIVWEWNIKDHLIQDYNSEKDNFGVVKDNPGKLDFNYINSEKAVANWLHFNSIQYNSELDQILISSRKMSEIYIIDHSTTTSEAKSSTGGLYGKGGDFLFRWGNPAAYDRGTPEDQKLFGQHYPHWIEKGLRDEDKIILFNNGGERAYSSVEIIEPDQSSPGVYLDGENGFLPLNAEYIYTASNKSDFFSAILSGAQRLPNGNTLICDGDSGYFFEIDEDENIVWEYVNPDAVSGPIRQGEEPSFNLVFRAFKFGHDYPAFQDRNLEPTRPIELNPNLSACTLTLGVQDTELNLLTVYPNPTKGSATINSSLNIETAQLFDVTGKTLNGYLHNNNINLAGLETGIYFLRVKINNQFITKKIIKN